MKTNTSSIRGIFFRNMVLLTLASIGMWCLIWIHSEYASLVNESEALRKAHIASQKKLIKSQVVNVVRYIEYRMAQADQRLKSNIREHVYTAHQIATNIYLQNKGSSSPGEIKKMIKDALRPIRFNSGRGYYFAVSMKGVEQLYPVKPELEGQNLLDLKDAKGNFVIRDEISVIKKSGEGYVQDFWAKPDEGPDVSFPKISFVKYFKPLDWYIGAGEYLDDVIKQIQTEVLDHIVGQRFGDEGYFFGSTYQGQPLFSNGNITKGTQSIWDLTDPNGIKIIQEQRKAVEKPEGGFVYYAWRKLGESTPTPKLSYVLGLDEWEWIIGAGVYLDTIEKQISSLKAIHMDSLQNKIQKSVILLMALFLLCFLWARYISDRIQTGIKTFSSFFNKAATESVTIDLNALYITEFQDIALLANKMVADQKKIQAALEESEEKYRDLVEGTDDFVAQVDIEGRLTYVNGTAEKVFGVGRDACIGLPAFDFVHPEDQEKTRKAFDQWVRNGVKSATFENRQVNKTTGKTHHMHWTINFHYDEDNTISGINCIAQDVTERMQAQAKKEQLQAHLLQIQKMESIATLAGGIAHKFNNALTIITGRIDFLQMAFPDDKQVAIHTREMEDSAHRMAQLTAQLLAYARGGKYQIKTIALCDFVGEALPLMEHDTRSSITIDTSLPRDKVHVKADLTQLQMVLSAVLANATEAIKDTGRIRIACGNEMVTKERSRDLSGLKPGRYAFLTVTDDGRGMDEETRNRVFEPFFTTKFEGRGLGMAAVYGIIINHDGWVHVESEPNQGTQVKIYLPTVKDFD